MEIRHGGTADDLRKQLQAAPTRRFLFSGHADANDPSGSGHTLGFTKPGGGDLELVRSMDVASVLGQHAASGLEFCFLNGCDSLELGRAVVAAGVPTVVCWRTKVFDPAARMFAKALFEALALGRTYREAFGSAVHALRFKTHPQPTNPLAQSVGAIPCVPVFQLCGPGPGVTCSFQCEEAWPCAYGCPRARCRLPIPCGDPILIDSNGELRGSDMGAISAHGL